MASRRKALKLGAAVGSTALITGCIGSTGIGGQDSFPTEEVVLINPYPPGGGTDAYFSQLVDPLSEELGVNVSQEYVSGAGGAAGVRQAYQEDNSHGPVNLNIPNHTILQFKLDNPGYKIQEFSGIGSFAWDGFVLITPADGYGTFEELRTAYQNGEATTIAGETPGGNSHMAIWSMKQNWGLDYDEYVGYDGGGDIISAVLRGEVDAGAMGTVPVGPYLEEGEVNALVFTGDESHPSIEDVPTSSDLDLESIAGIGTFYRTMAGPPSLEGDARDTFEEAFLNALESDSVQSWAEESGNPIIPQGSDVVNDVIQESFEMEDLYQEFVEATEEE